MNGCGNELNSGSYDKKIKILNRGDLESGSGHYKE